MERYMQRGRFFLLSEIQNALVHTVAFKAPGEDGLKLVCSINFNGKQWGNLCASLKIVWLGTLRGSRVLTGLSLP